MKDLILNISIAGYPMPLERTRRREETRRKCREWKKQILKETKQYTGIVKGPCKMKVVFKFHKEQFPKDLPYGPDLDNYLKSLQDALNETVFSELQGNDSGIVNLQATKYMANSHTGIHLKISKENLKRSI